MIDLCLDWRSLGRWGSLLPMPLADDRPRPIPDPTRYVLCLKCQHCSQRWLAAAPASMAQPCPACAGPLAWVGSWDLVVQAAPDWWLTEVSG
jgi:hypothetical protein